MDNKETEGIVAAVAQALKQAQSALPAQGGGFMPPQQQQPAFAQPMQQPQTYGVNPTGWSLPIEMNVNGMSFTVYLAFPAETFPQCAQIVQWLASQGYQVRGSSRGGFGGGNNYGGGGGGYGRYGGGYNSGYGGNRGWGR